MSADDDEVNVGNFGLTRLMWPAARQNFITFIRNKVHSFTQLDIYSESNKEATLILTFCRWFAALFLHVKAGDTCSNHCWVTTLLGRIHCFENVNYCIWSTWNLRISPHLFETSGQTNRNPRARRCENLKIRGLTKVGHNSQACYIAKI